jgi:hypothetical protein
LTDPEAHEFDFLEGEWDAVCRFLSTLHAARQDRERKVALARMRENVAVS